jgi:hypothetical protein
MTHDIYTLILPVLAGAVSAVTGLLLFPAVSERTGLARRMLQRLSGVGW